MTADGVVVEVLFADIDGSVWHDDGRKPAAI